MSRSSAMRPIAIVLGPLLLRTQQWSGAAPHVLLCAQCLTDLQLLRQCVAYPITMGTEIDVREQLKAQLREVLDGDEQDARRVALEAISAVFRTPNSGDAYFFLFTVSLEITNAALAELMAVVRRHLRRLESPASGFAFWDLESYTDALATAIEHVTRSSCDADHRASELLRNYETLLVNSVVFHPLKCSCTVYIPPAATFNLETATRDASYVYCSGRNIFTKGVKQVNSAYVDKRLERYLESYAQDQTLCFVPYCHEDFSEDDRDAVKFVNNALDEVKLDIEKSYFGSVPIVDWLKNQSNPALLVVDSNHYREHRQIQLDPPNSQRANSEHTNTLPVSSGTVWLISDRGVSLPQHAATRYYICYHQLYRRRDPFAAFDENKPAWIDQVTLPHSLTGTLLSIATGQLSTPVRVLDPFAGSCTTLLECGKRPELIKECIGIELFDGAQEVFDHNVAYFSNQLDREALFKSLTGLENQSVTWAALSAYDKDATFAASLKGKDLSSSIFAYLARRVAKRASRAIKREHDHTRHDGIAKRRWKAEIATLASQGNLTSNCYKTASTDAPDYSPEVHAHFAPSMREKLRLRCGPAQDVLKSLADARETFDLVVTDPPYSINHDVQLEAIIAETFGLCIDLVRDGGLFIVVLPFATFNGQPFSPQVAPHMVRQFVLLAAENRRRTAYTYFEWLHGTTSLLKEGIYWRSKKLLERRVMIFGVNGQRQT